MSKITLVALIFLLLNSHIHAGGKGKNKEQLYRKATKSLCTDGLKEINKYRADRRLPKNKKAEDYVSIATACENPAVNKCYVLSFSTCPNNATQKIDDVKNDVEKVCECDFKDSCEHQLEFIFKERNFSKKIDHCHTTCKSWLVSNSKKAEYYCYGLDWTRTTNLSGRLPASANTSTGCNTASSSSTTPSANTPSLLTVMTFLCFLNR